MSLQKTSKKTDKKKNDSNVSVQGDGEFMGAGEPAATPAYDDAPIVEVSYELLEEESAALRRRVKTGDVIDTAHTDGSTSNPVLAQKQGLVYDPPHDPPVLPGDDPQGARIAAGFAGAMEETDADARRTPARIAGNDLDLAQRVESSLRNNSETANLHDVEIAVRDGVVHMTGAVDIPADLAIVDEMIRDMQGVMDVRNDLEVVTPAER